MYVDVSTIIQAAAVVGALTTLCGAGIATVRWFDRQKKQDADIQSIKEEETLICYALMACLDGLEQLGANHTVSDAKKCMDKHLNEKAHD